MELVDELIKEYESMKGNPIKTTDYEKIIRAKKCHTCGSEDIDYKPVYGSHGEHVYTCKACKSFTTSLNKKVKNPKGIIANEELRRLQFKVHSLIDPMIKKKHLRNKVSLHKASEMAYNWMHKCLGIEDERINCWRMNKEQCLEAISILDKFYSK